MNHWTADRYWDFSLVVYGTQDVPANCLALQDRIGLDVNVLLMALLAVRVHERAITVAEVAQADQVILAWRQEIIVPLRTMRRTLKTGPSPAPDAATDVLREQIKSVELDAERIEQSVLSRWIAQLATVAVDGTEDAAANALAVTASRVVSLYAGQQQAMEDESELVRMAQVVANAARVNMP